MYITLTKGQKPIFREFLRQAKPKKQSSYVQAFKQFFIATEDEAEILVDQKFLDEQIKCLRLFRCFKEVGDEEICRCIENAPCFSHKVINLASISLSP